ncbi:MAG: hypothetical protein ABI234_13990 [Ktedonobacteraceae bacterium]
MGRSQNPGARAVKTGKAGEPQMQDLSSCSRLTDVIGFEKATLLETQQYCLCKK